jgi:hypothetical protein
MRADMVKINKLLTIYLVLILFITFYLVVALLTNNTFSIYHQPRYYLAYDDMWQHLISGSVEISPPVLFLERYYFEGKVLTYYLPFPALIRGFLRIFDHGSSAVLSVILAITTYIFACALIFSDITKAAFLLRKKSTPTRFTKWYFFPIIFLPIIGLCLDASIAWESLLWGLSIFLLSLYFVYKFIEQGKNLHGVLAIVLLSFTLYTRPTYIIAAIFLFIFLFTSIINKLRKNIFLFFFSLFFILSAILLGVYNNLKWNSPFTFAPMQYHEQLIGTARGIKMETLPSLSIERVPFLVDYYLLPTAKSINANSLGIVSFDKSIVKYDDSKFDYSEPKYTVVIMAPIFIILASLGLFSVIYNFSRSLHTNISKKIIFTKNLPILFAIIGASIPFIFILLVHSFAMRYRADMYPFFIILSSFGIGFYLSDYGNIKSFFIGLILAVITLFFILQSIVIERLFYFHTCLEITPNLICNFFTLLGS